ncbi:MAG: phage gp6-like head-tail connector protein [Ruminococcus sp.]|nr:phage gp6-like head-tail connector protein [Ruminococcus sp.]
MKISEVTDEQIFSFMRVDDPTDGDTEFLSIIKPAAKSFIIGYTALTAEELDEHEDLTIAYLILIEDMFDNRALTVNSANLNRTTENILSMYAKNHIG